MANGKRKFQWNHEYWEDIFAEPTGNATRLTTYVDESSRRIRLETHPETEQKFVMAPEEF